MRRRSQKIMYLADDHFRKSGVRDKSNVIFASAQGSLFAVEKYRKTLEKVAARKSIDVRLKHNLVEIKPDQKEAIFETLGNSRERDDSIRHDSRHTTHERPRHYQIEFSGQLGRLGGCRQIHAATPKFVNVFPIGDCSGLPTSKTGAAVRKQAPVLVQNLIAAIQGEPLEAKYDGYTSCPLVTGYGKTCLGRIRLRRQTSRNVSIRSVEGTSIDVSTQGLRGPDCTGTECCAGSANAEYFYADTYGQFAIEQ